MAGFCIGQALCPIPVVGGIIGGLVGEWLTSKIVGKSFSEKKAAAEEEKKKLVAQAGGFDTGSTNIFAQGGMNADQFMLQQLQMAMMQNPDLMHKYDKVA